MIARIAAVAVRTVEEAIPAILLGAMVVVIVVDVVGRYVFSSPIRGAAELATAAFIWVIFLGGAGAMRRRLHVNIDVLVALLPGRVQAIVYLLMHVALSTGMLLMVPLAWTYAVRNNRIILLLGIPYRYIYIVVAASFVLIALHSLAAAVRGARGLVRGQFSLPDADQDYGVAENTRPLFDPPPTPTVTPPLPPRAGGRA